jgi:hypothetical protein
LSSGFIPSFSNCDANVLKSFLVKFFIAVSVWEIIDFISPAAETFAGPYLTSSTTNLVFRSNAWAAPFSTLDKSFDLSKLLVTIDNL